jgi:hypothetical protein
MTSGQILNIPEIVKETGKSITTVRRWIRQNKHRKGIMKIKKDRVYKYVVDRKILIEEGLISQKENKTTNTHDANNINQSLNLDDYILIPRDLYNKFVIKTMSINEKPND